MKTAPTEKRKWASRKPAAHNEDQHGLLAVMAVGCWLGVGQLGRDRVNDYRLSTAMDGKRPRAGCLGIGSVPSGWIGGRGREGQRVVLVRRVAPTGWRVRPRPGYGRMIAIAAGGGSEAGA